MRVDPRARKREDKKIKKSLLRAHEYRTEEVEMPDNKKDAYASIRKYDSRSIHKKDKEARSNKKREAITQEFLDN